MKKFIAIILCIAVCTCALSARIIADSVRVYFPVSQTEIFDAYMGNADSLRSFADRLAREDSLGKRPLLSVKVRGSASPEGPAAFNAFLARARADTLSARLRRMIHVPDSVVSISSRAVTFDMLRKTARPDTLGQRGNATAYRHMLRHIFPSLRTASLVVTYADAKPYQSPSKIMTPATLARVDTAHIIAPEQPSAPSGDNVKWALRTNLLFDALAAPNIGAELYLGRNFSVQGMWTYAWWSHRTKNFFWRLYGGDVGLRWWFGKLARRRHLSGHHIGAYAQVLIWDFEFGGRGYMGGVPGCAIWDRANVGAGIEYGYSLPVTQRLNFDFCIGIGYLGGSCRQYIPQCGYYVWQSTRRLNYVGPTKLEISLVYTF